MASQSGRAWVYVLLPLGIMLPYFLYANIHFVHNHLQQFSSLAVFNIYHRNSVISKNSNTRVASEQLRAKFNSMWMQMAPAISVRDSRRRNWKPQLPQADTNLSWWRNLDLLQTRSPVLDSHYRNPCWMSDSRPVTECWSQMWPRSDWSFTNTTWLRCLPYFLVIGQSKCGTTDIWEKLRMHPEVITNRHKELNWWNKIRLLRYTCSSFETYIEMFQMVANQILQLDRAENTNPYVTGEATPAYLSVNKNWQDLPGNAHCREPCVTHAHHIRHLMPWAKIIIGLRNPTDRFFSYYLHQQRLAYTSGSLKGFHEFALNQVKYFNNCLKTKSLRSCCYNIALKINEGIYHVYIEDWFKVFPRKQIHIYRFENYVDDTTQQLTHIYDFLQLKTLSAAQMRNIVMSRPANAKPEKQRSFGNMWNTTRQLLDAFYQPYTRMLATLLNDERYLWQK